MLTQEKRDKSGREIQRCMTALGIGMADLNLAKIALFHDGTQAMIVSVTFERPGQPGDFPLISLEEGVVTRLGLKGQTFKPHWKVFEFNPQLVSLAVDDEGHLFHLIFGLQ